jgi:hypothetical protein
MHTANLLKQHFREFRVASLHGALTFLRQDRERSFEAMREIPGFGLRSLHGAFALLEKRIQIVDEGLNLVGIRSGDDSSTPVANLWQLGSQTAKGSEGAADYCHPARHYYGCNGNRDSIDHRKPVKNNKQKQHVGKREQRKGPQQTADQEL